MLFYTIYSGFCQFPVTLSVDPIPQHCVILDSHSFLYTFSIFLTFILGVLLNAFINGH
jgi:hypothetical protein